MKRALLSFTVVAVLSTGALAASPLPTDALAGLIPGPTAVVETTGVVFAAGLPNPVACPDIYFPVICSNGQVYGNACYAEAAGATGCQPYGGDV